MRLGYQIPNFTYPDVAPGELFGRIADQATEAEAAGFDRVMVMDHFYQLPGLGQPDEPMLECYTLLAALAQHTERVELSALVTGNTYRNPTLLAKTITALDVVSGGRAVLGIGAGWYELEHDQLGFEFQTFTERFEKLEEALQVILPMLRGEPATLDGTHYTATDARNVPAPLRHVPVMIGGGGEKKTLRMVAQYADESNLLGVSSPDQIRHKLDVLAEHCATFDRDPDDVHVTMLVSVNVAPTMEEATADLRAMADLKGWGQEGVERSQQRMVHGDPDTVGEQLTALVDAGLDGLAINCTANGHVPGRVALAGEVAHAALGG